MTKDLHPDEIGLQTTYRLLESLEQSNESYRRLVATLSDVVFEHDDRGLLFLNEAWEKNFGFSIDSSLSLPLRKFVAHNDKKKLSGWFKKTRAKPGNSCKIELRLLDSKNTTNWIEINGSFSAVSQRFSGILHDIQGRKQSELCLKKSERHYHSLTENLTQEVEDSSARLSAASEAFKLRFFTKDLDLHYLSCNQLFAEDAGFASPNDVVGKTDFDMSWADFADQFRADDQAVILSGQSKMAYGERKTLGRWAITTRSPIRDSRGSIIGIQGMYQDISTLKEAEIARARLSRAYGLLIDSNSWIVQSDEESLLLEGICQLVIANGYRMAWIGIPDSNLDAIQALAKAGPLEKYFSENQFSSATRSIGGAAAKIAASEAKTVVVNDNLIDPITLPWWEGVNKPEWRSNIALPLIGKEKTIIAVFTLYASEQNAFDEEEVRLLEELARSLAFGIESLRNRKKRFEILESTVSAIAATIESRDPYTAGHQRRVARLAELIANEMHVPKDEAQGIHFAAMMHDVGKIYVPTEFLTRPKILTGPELAIVRSHPEVGYLILRNIPFPWPVAEMVHQHHERLDGSGYPKGLKGDEINFGARIIAVADVVEAMSMSRPYREGLGIETALSEITERRGTAYDADVVDACLELFNKKGITLADLA